MSSPDAYHLPALIGIFALGAIIMTVWFPCSWLRPCKGGNSLAVAIALTTLLGPCQVVSRVLQMLASKRHPIWTALVSVVFVAVGMLLVATAPGATSIGLLLYGLGNGLRAIVLRLVPLSLEALHAVGRCPLKH